MEEVVLTAEAGRTTGSATARRLRGAGKAAVQLAEARLFIVAGNDDRKRQSGHQNLNGTAGRSGCRRSTTL